MDLTTNMASLESLARSLGRPLHEVTGFMRSVRSVMLRTRVAGSDRPVMRRHLYAQVFGVYDTPSQEFANARFQSKPGEGLESFVRRCLTA